MCPLFAAYNPGTRRQRHLAPMPSPDDKLTDIPIIVPTRDDDLPARGRTRPEPGAAPARGGAGPSPQPQAAGSWRYIAIFGLIVALATAAIAGLLFQRSLQLEAALAQSNQRIQDLEGKLSTTDDSVNQSSAAMQVKIKELAGEVDKLWASAWRKNDARLVELEKAGKQAAGRLDAQQKQLVGATAGIDQLKTQVGTATDLAGTVGTLRQQQQSMQDAVSRMNSTVNTVSGTQRAQEARIKEMEQWVQSNIEFRKQVTQRLTRLENPPSALPQ